MIRERLLEILRDPTASDAEKDDAVIELGEKFQDAETVDMLIEISNESNYDEMIKASCGESISHIWLATQEICYEKLFELKGIAFTEAISLIKAQRPDWYETYLHMFPE